MASLLTKIEKKFLGTLLSAVNEYKESLEKQRFELIIREYDSSQGPEFRFNDLKMSERG